MSRNGRHKVLVLGSRGLVGHQVFNELAKDTENYKVFGTLRGYNEFDSQILNEGGEKILVQDLRCPTELQLLLNRLKPHSIVNCLSIASHKTASERNLERTFSHSHRCWQNGKTKTGTRREHQLRCRFFW